MGADESTLGDGSADPLETLCTAMDQMSKNQGSAGTVDPKDLRQNLLKAKDSIGQNIGGDPNFHKILEELERKTAADGKAEISGKQAAAAEPTAPRKFEFVLKNAAEGHKWGEKIEALAKANGISEDDLDEDTLAMADADGVDLDTDTEEEPDWDSLKYPIAGSICEKVYEIKDVSWTGDGSLMKKKLEGGEGENSPLGSAKVKVRLEEVSLGGVKMGGAKLRTSEFVLGNGEVCDALEIAAFTMKKKERATFTCTDLSLCADKKLGWKGTGEGTMSVTLELVDFEVTETKGMSEEHKIRFGTALKESGSSLFRDGRTHLALRRYKEAIEFLTQCIDFSPDHQTKVRDVARLCELNRAACYVKLSKYSDAKVSCTAVLGDEPENVKALYRRAQCNVQLKSFGDAVTDLRKVVDLDPKNKAARDLLKEAQKSQKGDDDKSKGLFAKMLHDPRVASKTTDSKDAEILSSPISSGMPHASVRLGTTSTGYNIEDLKEVD